MDDITANYLPKMTKTQFEEYLWVRNNKQTMETSKYDGCTLYYNNEGHIGTWRSGQCWTFESNLPEDGSLQTAVNSLYQELNK